VVSDANSISLVSIDSTKQHGVHVFDVNCHICTGSQENTRRSGLTSMPTSCQSAALPKDSDSLSQDVNKSDHSPRKKICLAQRLKMYSTELQRNNISSANKQVDGKCLSELVSDADVTVAKMAAVSGVEQTSDVHEIHSSHEPTLDKPKLTLDASEWHVQTVHNLQNESSVEQRNSDKQKLEKCSTGVNGEPEKASVTSSCSDTTKQQLDLGTWEFAAPQEAHFKKNHVATGYATL